MVLDGGDDREGVYQDAGLWSSSVDFRLFVL